MFTVCPKCSLKLVVTAADLRMAQGYVRCGRCSDVFNALVGLSDEQQAVLALEERAAAGREQPAAQQNVSAGADTRADEPVSDAALEFDPVATDVSEVFVEPKPDEDGSTGQSETIILRSEDAAPSEDAEEPLDAHAGEDTNRVQIVELELDPAATEGADEFELADLELLLDANRADDALTVSPAREVEDAPEGTDAQGVAQVSDTLRVADPSGGPHEPPSSPAGALDPLAADAPATRRIDWALRIGSVALTLLLAVQIAHHYRATLADIDWLRPPLTAIYAAIGMPLVPHWDVAAYEVRQLGAVAGPENPGALTVRASIKNTAPRQQPLPLLRVTVQDRFGNRVAARDVSPREYLPKASAGRRYLAAGQRVDAEIALVDPGPNVVGFEIDACLADAAGRVSCANDAHGVH